MTIENCEIVQYFKQFNVSIELIDLITLRPIDWKTIFKSINKLKVVSFGRWIRFHSVLSEIVSRSVVKFWNEFKSQTSK